MFGVNKVTLLGNLGKDPEIKHLDSGRARVTVSLATGERYKNKSGELITNTEWHNLVFWSPLAEIVYEYLKKGSKVYIEGKITTRSYVDKDENVKYITEIVGKELVMLDSKNTSATSPENHNKDDVMEHSTTAPEGSDELPF